ncbi:MAG: LptF/LptG family permease, partial [Pseudomonadota bacterium]|nr:LptF/LptG family permease [Pseudomonadota bacterium]
MSIIGRYHFRALLVATVFVTVVLTFAVWLSQSIAVLEMVAEGGAPISLFLRIVMLMIPEFLAIVLPIALFVCTLFIYHKAQGDCELIVLRASGIGPWRLARPALILAFLVAGVAIATGGWLAPWAKNETRSLVSLIKSNHAGLIIRPNVFNEIHGGPTIYIRDKT